MDARRRSLGVLLAIGALMATGCASGTAPGDVDHLVLHLDPDRPAFPAQDSTTVTVTAIARDGASMPAHGATFTSSAPSIAIVDPNRGLVYPQHNGRATIEASYGGKRARIDVAVRGTLHRDFDIDQDSTWRVADTPHVVTSFMQVGWLSPPPQPHTTVLTIEPGVVVRFRTGAGLIFGNIGPGELHMASGAPVVLEADTLPPHPGSWVGLYFQGVGHSELRNLTIRHCGHDVPAGYPGTCLSTEADVLIDGVTVALGHNGMTLGVLAPGGQNLSVENTDGYLGLVAARAVGDFPRGGHFSGNAVNELVITGGAFTHSAVWNDLGIPMRLGGSVTASGPEAPILTLPAGMHLRADPQTDFDFETGGLVAGDTAGPPVVLESNGRTWSGITTQHAGLSALRNVVLKDCGDSQGGCLVLEGLCGTDSGLVAQTLTIQGSRSAGVWMGICGKIHPSSRNITITGSATVPLELMVPAIEFLPAGNYLGNGWDVIRVRGGSPPFRQTWHNYGLPYALMGGFSADSTLTIDPGVVIEVDTGWSFNVGWGLNAQGTAAAPITFTSITPGVAGSWIGFNVGNPPDGIRLDHVVIADAGGGFAPGYGGAIRFGLDPGGVLTNSTIIRSANCGMVLLNGNSWTDDYTAAGFGNTFISVTGPLRCQV